MCSILKSSRSLPHTVGPAAHEVRGAIILRYLVSRARQGSQRGASAIVPRYRRALSSRAIVARYRRALSSRTIVARYRPALSSRAIVPRYRRALSSRAIVARYRPALSSRAIVARRETSRSEPEAARGVGLKRYP